MNKRGQGAIEAPFGKACAEKAIAQGAIEYLLLLAAAIVVVAIVISFLSSTIQPVTGQGNKQLYDSLCTGPLAGDGNTLLCGCYLKDQASGTGEFDNTGAWIDANHQTCPEKLPEQYKNDPLLDWVPVT